MDRAGAAPLRVSALQSRCEPEVIEHAAQGQLRLDVREVEPHRGVRLGYTGWAGHSDLLPIGPGELLLEEWSPFRYWYAEMSFEAAVPIAQPWTAEERNSVAENLRNVREVCEQPGLDAWLKSALQVASACGFKG
jgi:hypothetical protein